ncbi:MAG: hypothetical protein JXB46_10680 [Candidatus Eisenbacteria bacterium]|nr:hypothetical protein [Candidatus Eisenbacteria bacterium]
MRTATLAVVLLAALAIVAAATTDHYQIRHKDANPTMLPDADGAEVGEDIGTAIPISVLPFTDSGSSCGHLDDYDVACPYPESTSPDVVYSYAAATDLIVNVSLCGSSYDTKVYIYENVEGDIVCCNDDACGPTGYQSFMENVFLYAGNTYYFVVDGYGGDCGDYMLEILPMNPCVLAVPPGSIPEGEPPCGPGYEDHHNGGCNSDPMVFQDIMPSSDDINIVGTSGTYDDLHRDTDWYQIYVSVPNTITITAVAQFPLLIFFLDGNLPLGCDDPGLVISSATAAPCESAILTETVGPGVYWIWVGPSVFACQPCGLEYVLTIDGYIGPSPVEDASWATIKALFR